MTDELNDKIDEPVVYEDRKIYNIPVDKLLEDKEQHRKYFDNEAQDALKASIIRYGLMQPIVFRQRDKDGKLMVVAGERRVRAIKSILRKAKTSHDDPAQQDELIQRFSAISGLFITGKHEEIALIENVQRENLSPVELAEGLAKLQMPGQTGLELLGRLIGKSTSSVSEILSINKLPEEIRDEARGRKDISQWVLVEVAKAKGAKARTKKWDKLKDSGLTQAAYKKQKKEAAEKGDGQGVNFGNSMRAVKTASTQLQKLIGPEIESITTDERQKLREQLEALRDELEHVLSGL